MTRGEPQAAQPLSRPSGFCSFPDMAQHTPMTQLLWPGGMWSRNKDWTWARLGNNNSNSSRRWLPWCSSRLPRQPDLWGWPELRGACESRKGMEPHGQYEQTPGDQGAVATSLCFSNCTDWNVFPKFSIVTRLQEKSVKDACVWLRTE